MVTTAEQAGGDDEEGGAYHPSAVPWMVGRMADGAFFKKYWCKFVVVDGLI